jgi:hypothetical protein
LDRAQAQLESAELKEELARAHQKMAYAQQPYNYLVEVLQAAERKLEVRAHQKMAYAQQPYNYLVEVLQARESVNLPASGCRPPPTPQLPHPRTTVRSPRKPNHCLSLTSD